MVSFATREWLSRLSSSTARKDGARIDVESTPLSDTETLCARADLSPTGRAEFAVTSRLIASIVTEGLLEAAYLPVCSTLCAGFCVVLSSSKRSEETPQTLDVNDVFAFVPLHHAPILKPELEPLLEERRVWLLDPYDMIPVAYYLQNCSMSDVSSFRPATE